MPSLNQPVFDSPSTPTFLSKAEAGGISRPLFKTTAWLVTTGKLVASLVQPVVSLSNGIWPLAAGTSAFVSDSCVSSAAAISRKMR